MKTLQDLLAQSVITVTDVRPFVQELYNHCCVGCCLHIVLDDGNIRDSDIEFCINYAIDKQHKECENLARVLLRMSKTQRQKLYRS